MRTFHRVCGLVVCCSSIVLFAAAPGHAAPSKRSPRGNTQPVARDQAVTTAVNTPKAITLVATDSETRVLTYSIVSNPTKGSLSGTPPSVTYTPSTDYSGPDSFTFQAADGQTNSNVATVSITVTRDDASEEPMAYWKMDETSWNGTAGEVKDSAAWNMNGRGLNGANTVTNGRAGRCGYFDGINDYVRIPNKSSISMASDLTISFWIRPENLGAQRFNPLDKNYGGEFALTIEANRGLSYYHGAARSSGSYWSWTALPAGSLTNGAWAHVTITRDTGTRAMRCYLNGSLKSSATYPTKAKQQPSKSTNDLCIALGYTGYALRGRIDEVRLFDTVVSAATVSWLSGVPVADNQSVATPEDTPTAIALMASDPDGDTLTYTITANPAKGTLSGTAPNVTYTPMANTFGTDTFKFCVSDGIVNSATATVTMTVSAVNDPPVASNQTVTTAEDTAKAITLTARDIETNALTYSIETNPTKGTLSGTPPNVTYMPDPNYNGADSFTFRANDGLTNGNVATVSITVAPVNDAPVANDQSLTTPEDTAKDIVLTATDIDADALAYTIMTEPANGVLSGMPPNVTYTPNANYFGSDTFTFRVNDGLTNGNVAPVSITVTPVNDAPVANDQSVTTAEDTAKAIVLTAEDIEADAMAYTIMTAPANGVLSGTPPNVTYTPNANYFGSDSFTFQANDGLTASASATVSITVTAVNDAPVANNQSVTTLQDTAKSITLTASDADNNPLMYYIVVQPSHGALSGTAPNVTYMPVNGYSGPDVFAFLVSDGEAASAVATVSITVEARPSTLYVDVANTSGIEDGSPAHPYNTIQEAIAVAGDGGVVLVAQGRYVLAFQIEITNGVAVRGVDGPSATIVDGNQSVRCFSLNHSNAVVEGFTITRGRSSEGIGGGVLLSQGLVDRCVIVSNVAHCAQYYIGSGGGGVYISGGILRSCLIRGNVADPTSMYGESYGGGVECGYGSIGIVENCTIIGNYASASYVTGSIYGGGGGVYAQGGQVRNSIIFYNVTSGGVTDPNVRDYVGSFSYCTATPLLSGEGNRAEAPLFVDLAAGDFHLSIDRPYLMDGFSCVNAGTNQGWMAGAVDLDGRERILNGTVDRGAYEYVAGDLVCDFTAAYASDTSLTNIGLTAHVAGTNMAGLYCRWDLDGDGTTDREGYDLLVVTNGYAPDGLYSVVLSVTNAAGETASIRKDDYVSTKMTVYVSPLGSHTYPFATWATAATNIQNAIDVGRGGAVVLVTNGTYRLGAQLTISKTITLQSVNGPEQTVVDGNGAVRCLYLSGSNAVVDGFTITHGLATNGFGGGVYSVVGGTIRNCIIASNMASNNLARYTQGWGPSYGGGVYFTGNGVLQNCLVRGNTAAGTGHYSEGLGGGVFCGAGSVVENCTIVGNIGFGDLNGYYRGGGGICAYGTTVRNTIVWSNTAPSYPNWLVDGNVVFSHCDTYPLPPGEGNFSADPLFLDEAGGDYRLDISSPCMNTGTNLAWMASAPDLDGRDRIIGGVVDRGAYEFDADVLTCAPSADKAEGVSPLTAVFTALVAGTNAQPPSLYYRWDLDNDGIVDLSGWGLSVVTNIYSTVGSYSVSLTVSNTGGEVATATRTGYINVGHATVYVSQAGSHTYPYTNWAMAATNIQAAADAGVNGTVVLVTNGTYGLSSQTVLSRGVTVRSVNGPAVTIVDGNEAVRCFFLDNAAAVVDGFTITRGRAQAGAGVFCNFGGTVQNCIIYSNSASSGGGVYFEFAGCARNCLITHNTCEGYGGGVMCDMGGTVENCTIAYNSAGLYYAGSGISSMSGGRVRNTIVYFNDGVEFENSGNGMEYSHTCAAVALPGVGNTTNDPLFIDSGNENYRLTGGPDGSPCINAGENQDWMAAAVDLDGRARIIGGVVDMGAYEASAAVPVAYDQVVTTAEDTPVAITLTASASDGASLTFTVVSSPLRGELSGTPPYMTYTPSNNYYGSDSFTFLASDGFATSGVATVTITVTNSAVTIYVDDSNAGPGDGSQANPYNTIMEGVNVALPGDTIMVNAGIYDEAVVLTNRTDITLKGASEQATLTYPGMKLYVDNSENCWIEGFTFTGGTRGVSIRNSKDVTFTRNTMTGITNDLNDWAQPMWVVATTVRIIDNVFRSIVGGQLGALGLANCSCMVESNDFIGCSAWNSGAAIRLYTSGAGYTNRVKNNYIESCVSDFSAIEVTGYGHENTVLDHNTIYHSGSDYNYGGAIRVWWYQGAATQAIQIVNNTFYNPVSAWGPQCAIYVNTGKVYFANNIVAASYYAVYNLSVSDAVQYDYNDKYPYYWGNYNTPEGTGNITSDPLFVNLDVLDLRLQTNSPCIDAGHPDPFYNDADGSRNDMGVYGGNY
ncbi:MAG: Ig-like domain-containing protein [bacterium]